MQWRVLIDHRIVPLIKDYCEQIGLDPSSFAAHSTRSGYVTSSSERGVPISKMMKRTRHKIVSSLQVYMLTNSRGGNITICAAISPTLGVLHHKIKPGAFNSDEYVAFLRELVDNRPVMQLRSSRIVMDNAPFHKMTAVRSVFAERNPIHI